MSEIPEHFFHGEDLKPDKARARLLAECAGHEEQIYNQPLTSEELTERKDRLVQVSVQHEKLEEEKKKAMTEFKGKMDPLAQERRLVLRDVKNESKEVRGEVYLIPFPEERKMATYSEDGRLLSTRAMTPEERQGHIVFPMRAERTGTDD